jgi:lipopolysaccharide biosynthesis glycosyltransferase
MTRTLHVSCAVQGLYVPHSAAMLHSVMAHAGELEVHVHYLHGPGFPSGSAVLLRDMVQRDGGAIDFLEITDEQVAGLPVVAEFTKAMWYRIFLPQLLPGVDRVLYLDVDTLAMDDLGPLWATDLDGAYVGAVTNVFQHDHAHHPRRLGLSGPEVYFNSGVLLMDLDAMRRDDIAGALHGLALERGDALAWPDQDALNLVLSGRRKPLHPRWNCMNSVLSFPAAEDVFGAAAVAEAMASPGIRHFEGPGANKPWHPASDQPGREAYFEHRGATPWPA